jgi:hypothetical protein
LLFHEVEAKLNRFLSRKDQHAQVLIEQVVEGSSARALRRIDSALAKDVA